MTSPYDLYVLRRAGDQASLERKWDVYRRWVKQHPDKMEQA